MSGVKIAAKLAKIAGEIGKIEKGGYNQAQRYAFARDEDISDAIRPVLARNGVAIVKTSVQMLNSEARETTNRDNRTVYSTYTEVHVKISLADVDTGEMAEFEGIGSGIDSGDKSVYKAITGAKKYAWIVGLTLSFGEDPEADEALPNREQPKPQANPAQTKKYPQSPMEPPTVAKAAANVAALTGDASTDGVPDKVVQAAETASKVFDRPAEITGPEEQKIILAAQETKRKIAQWALDLQELGQPEDVKLFLKTHVAWLQTLTDTQRNTMRDLVAAKMASLGSSLK